MQKSRRPSYRFALFSLAALAIPASAQTPAAAPPPALDLTLLKKALAPLATEGLLQSRSLLQMSGSKSGISFTFHEQVEVTAKRPGKFRASVTQIPTDGAPPTRFLIVSDGVKVWTYRPGLRQYSVRTAAAFHAANDEVTTQGLATGGFFLGDGHQMAQGLNAATQENSPQILAALSDMGIGLSGHTETVNGEDDFVYHMALNKQGLSYRFVIDPATTTLRQIELAGRQNGINIAFQETITQIQPLGSVEKSTFQFTPPPGTVKVASLSVDPF